MLLPRDDLELMLREFGVKDLGELMQKRTSTDKVVKPSVFSEAPRRVEMTPDECKKLCEKCGLRYVPGYESRVIERVTTTELPDRYGDIVRAKGIDNANYRKNAVVLFSHNHGDFPVGKSIKEWIDKSINGWRSWDLYFNDEVDPTGKSDLTFRMVDSGAMPGGSIGFIPGTMKTDHTPEERSELGLGRFGVEYITCEKLEHSACSVPANPEALSNCLKSIEGKRLKALFAVKDVDRMVAEKMLNEELADVFASVLGVKRTISIAPVILTEGNNLTPKVISNIPAEPPAPPAPVPVINITNNIDSKPVQDLLNEANVCLKNVIDKVEILQGGLTASLKSFESRYNELLTATQRALTALESRTKTAGLYDRKELEGVLKLPKT